MSLMMDDGNSEETVAYSNSFDGKFHRRVAKIYKTPQRYRKWDEELTVLAWKFYQLFQVPVYYLVPFSRNTLERRLDMHTLLLESYVDSRDAMLYDRDRQGDVSLDIMEELANTGDYDSSELEVLYDAMVRRGSETKDRIARSVDEMGTDYEDSELFDRPDYRQTEYDEYDYE